MIETEAVIAQGTLHATCSRDALLQALSIVSRGVSTRTTVQILAGILLEAREGRLQLAATDMELSLRSSLEARIEPCSRFHQKAQQIGKEIVCLA